MTVASPAKSIIFDQANLSQACLDDLQQYFWTRSIELLGGQTSPADPEIYQGTGSLLNVSCQIEALSKTDKSLFVLCAQPQEDGWDFGTCFPLMPGESEFEIPSGADELEPEDAEEPNPESPSADFFLRFVTLQKPIWLYIYSASPLSSTLLQSELNKLSIWNQFSTQGKSAFPVKTGFFMRGPLPDALPGLQELADFIETDLSALILQAGVTFPDEFPVLTLQLPLVAEGCKLGPGTLKNAAIELSSPLYFSPYSSQINLLGTLNLTDLGEMDVRVDFPVAGDLITATGTYRKQGIPFVESSNLADLPDLQSEGGVELEVELQFSKSQKTLEKAGFSMDLENWSLIDDILTLQALSFSFSVFEPLGSKMVIASITAQAVLGNKNPINLLCSGYYPTNQLYLRFDSHTPLKIAPFIADLGAESEGLPDLQIDDLSVDYNLTSKDFKTLVSVSGSWEIIDEVQLHQLRFKIHGRDTYSCDIAAQLSIGEVAHLYLAASYSNQAWLFQGGTLPGQTIRIQELVTALEGMFGEIELPEVLDSLEEITNLQVSFNTATKDFYFVAETVFQIDDQDAALSINLDIVRSTAGFQKTFSGLLTIGTRQFSVLFESTPSTQSLQASFANPVGEEIDLVAEIVDLISKKQDAESPLAFPKDDQLNLTHLILYELQLTYKQEKGQTVTNKSYGLKGDFGWKPRINLNGESAVALDVHAQVDLQKLASDTDPKHNKVLGTICGEIQSTIEGLEFLSLGICYQRTLDHPDQPPSDTNELIHELQLQLTIGRVTFQAVHENKDGVFGLTFAVAVQGALTLGDVVSFFASLVDPSIVEFEFEPPWNFITDFDLAGFLNSIDLKLEVTGTTKEKLISVGFKSLDEPEKDIYDSLVPEALKPFLTINTFGLEYSSRTGKTKIILGAVFLEESQTLDWDPINEAPPEIPGQGVSVFELRYLGLGQHVSFENINRLNNITSVMQALEDSAVPLLPADKDKNPLTALAAYPSSKSASAGKPVFSPTSEWLIGLDISLLKTINLMVIFNDPVIYGLRIELYGKLAKNFAGLQFEILYQRISATLGKYHTELTLPDKFRYMQVGAVSITLPLIVVDIFTNGDFKVDLGFPWNFNFARSFAIEVFPFTGAGGFYFNKLSAATTTLVPTAIEGHPLKPPEKGVFTPVYEFGLGLRIGYGKSFHSGPLNAEIQITVQGLITGVISWYNPIEGDRELYYKIAGGVAIVGRLYGEVDFGIISVSVEVIARAMITFVVEVYQPIPILLAADVSVKASVKVAFITISFSFSLRVEQEFIIPSPQGGTLPPWVQ